MWPLNIQKGLQYSPLAAYLPDHILPDKTLPGFAGCWRKAEVRASPRGSPVCQPEADTALQPCAAAAARRANGCLQAGGAAADREVSGVYLGLSAHLRPCGL